MVDDVNQNNYRILEVIAMATVPTQIRIDSDIKKQATDLFSDLGLDMSSAVNMFLHQCIFRGGLPFAVEMPRYGRQTLEVMEEARQQKIEKGLL